MSSDRNYNQTAITSVDNKKALSPEDLCVHIRRPERKPLTTWQHFLAYLQELKLLAKILCTLPFLVVLFGFFKLLDWLKNTQK
ncbi:hypothetical protein V5J35_001863 [Endozoicomonas sp. NE40]|uniref:Uncharacterized protein n=1 Tax=Endozoicomonas lisbonensis TaxID=3120522 RepID=A0ABV2SFW7_9GAMM